METETAAPGEKPRFLGVRENRWFLLDILRVDGFLEIFLLALLLALALLETDDPPDAVYAPKHMISRD